MNCSLDAVGHMEPVELFSHAVLHARLGMLVGQEDTVAEIKNREE